MSSNEHGLPGPAGSRGPRQSWPAFTDVLRSRGLTLERRRLTTLQVNMGRLCNQACHHCHVDAGPKRTEIMAGETAERIVELLAGEGGAGVTTVDVTGGAPELNPSFRYLVSACRELGKGVIDRCNLTVLLLPGQEDTVEFLAAHEVEIVASLPCYTRQNVAKQRGNGVFEASIEALRRLNAAGYGCNGNGLGLHLAYNPGGPSLPPPHAELEAEYKAHLSEELGIVFDRLLTMTNLPIHRFRLDLERSGRLERYMEVLAREFHEENAAGVMCRNLVSVSWDGGLYDCDFNQMLSLPAGGRPRTIWDLESLAELDEGPIVVGDHCFGCTAGTGSSCGGALF